MKLQTPTKPVSRFYWHDKWVPLVAVVVLGFLTWAALTIFGNHFVRTARQATSTTVATVFDDSECVATIISGPTDTLHGIAARSAFVQANQAMARLYMRRLVTLNPGLPEHPPVGTEVRVPKRLSGC